MAEKWISLVIGLAYEKFDLSNDLDLVRVSDIFESLNGFYDRLNHGIIGGC